MEGEVRTSPSELPSGGGGWDKGEEDMRKTLLARLLLIGAIIPVFLSIQHQFWRVKVIAPQYPQGLSLYAYVNRLEGDVREIDILNHYIGMKPLEEAAKFERKIAIPAVYAVMICALLSAFLPFRWSRWLAWPLIIFPIAFMTDLYLWLRHYGLNLDPKAPLNHAVKPFVPPLIGKGKVAQFVAYAHLETGFWLALAGSILALIGFFLLKQKTVKEQVRSVEGSHATSVAAGFFFLAFFYVLWFL